MAKKGCTPWWIKNGAEHPMKNPETKRKQSETRKRLFREGKIDTKGEKNGMFNKAPWNKGKPFMKLDKNPNWHGGKSFEPYSLEFNKQTRKKIKERDNYNCQICGINQEKLNKIYNDTYKKTLRIHHIDYNKQNNKPNNLISLCLPCHAKTNQNREDWINYFQNKVGNFNEEPVFHPGQ